MCAGPSKGIQGGDDGEPGPDGFAQPRPAFGQRCLTNLARTFLPSGLTYRLGWDVYRELDAMVYVVEHEWETAKYLFRAESRARATSSRTEWNADALADLARPQAQEDYLVCAATIHPRKNSVMLAQAAHLAGVPVVFLGKPYAPDDAYFLEFQKHVDNKMVRYPGFVSTEEKHRYLRGARGFVLISQFESGSIAVYEAAAAGLPLLLSDLPWANKVYRQARDTSFVSPVRQEESRRPCAPFMRRRAGSRERPSLCSPGGRWRNGTWKSIANCWTAS